MKSKKKAIMNFHCYGEVSQEEYEIVSIKGGVVTLDTDFDIDKCFKFNIKSGVCLNDNTSFGARRTLKI